MTSLGIETVTFRLVAYVLTYLLTELSSSWEAANCAATQELPSILRNPKVHHRVHKSPPLVSILSQILPVHTIPFYLSKIYFNIVHRPTSWFSQFVAYVRIIYLSLCLYSRIGVDFTSDSPTEQVAFSGRFHVVILMVTLSTSTERFQLLENFCSTGQISFICFSRT
jgi:hypothetical protein